MLNLSLSAVGTRRWSCLLWISEWTLSWTQFPRIPQFSHLGANSAFSYYWAGPFSDQIVKILAPSFVLSLLNFSPQGAACPHYLFFWLLLRAGSYISSMPKDLLLTAVTQGPAGVSDQLAPTASMQSLSDQFPPPAVFYKTTTLFNLGITTFSCLAHQPRRHQRLFFEDWKHWTWPR